MKKKNKFRPLIGKNQIHLWLTGLLFLCCSMQMGAQTTVTGTVTDSERETMPGVSVVLKGTTVGTITDVDGNFKLNVPNDKAILVFSFLGYTNQEVTVGTKRTFDVTLEENTVMMAEVEVVAVGYGSIRRRDITGSVASANMTEIQKAPVSSIAEGLAGRLSGVQVIFADGAPGGSASIVIRGGNSITQDNNPLYVVDGFPQENFDMGTLDPSEIESIDVLKDASATAIYGSRGANGVVLIATKRGMYSKPLITYRGRFGVQTITKRVDVMSPYDYVQMEIERDPYKLPVYTAGRTLEDYKNVEGIDWQDKMLRTGTDQNHSISLRGGTETTKYSFAGNIYKQDAILIESTYDRYSGKISLDQEINKRLKVGLTGEYMYRNYSGPKPSLSQGWTSSHYLMFRAWSYMPIPYRGSVDTLENELVDPDINTGTDYRVNPVISTENEHREEYQKALTANAYIEYQILSGLKFKTIGQVYQYSKKNEIFNNSKTSSGAPWAANQQNGSIEYYDEASWSNENILTYQFNLQKEHDFTLMGVFSLESNDNSKYGYSSDHVENEAKGTSGLDEGSVYHSVAVIDPGSSLMSYLGRVNYGFNNKYLLTASVRWDGSSKFADGNKWGVFPSVSLGWKFNKEAFLSNFKILSNGKLRAGWGETGNNRIPSTALYDQFQSPINQQYPLGSNSNWQDVAVIDVLGNKKLKWETTAQTNIGLDLGFFDERITLTADVYRKDTRDLLMKAAMPTSTGFNFRYKNVGSVRNEGLELTLNTINIKTKDFQWGSNFNIAFNKNAVEKLDEGLQSYPSAVSWDQDFNTVDAYIARLNGPIGQIYGYVWDGVYQKEDFTYDANGIPANKPNVPSYLGGKNQPGDIKYKDLNNDGIVNDDDRTVIGNTQPLSIGGFNNTFSYKDFDMSIFFQWSYGFDVLNANRLLLEWGAKSLTNQYATFVDRWTPQNTDTDMPRLNSNGMKYYSSRVVEDGSFLRFKTLSFGYKLPKKLLHKMSIKDVRLSISAQNLYTWTNYSGYDPEVSSKHTALTPNFDYSAYPRASTFTFGVDITF